MESEWNRIDDDVQDESQKCHSHLLHATDHSTPSRIMTSLIPFMHHEKQEKGSMLCAQHALNSVLQGQYFDPSQLSQIATRLDGLEKDQMEEQQWRQRGKDKSTLNMDDTGK